MKKNILTVAAVALGIAFFEVGCGAEPPPCGAEPPPCVWGGWCRMGITPLPPPFQILGIIFACCLMKSIRSGYEVM